MKIIYLANDIYEQNILKNNIQIINKKEKANDGINKNIIVCAGNQLNSNKKIEEDDCTNFIAQINKINDKFIKYILYGSLDLDMETNCTGLKKSIDSYKKDKNFINIFGIDYIIVLDTIIIFINNFFNITNNIDANITSTCFKYLITLEPIKYKDNMTIRNLIELEINELTNIIKKNINIKTMIFMTQTPLVVPDYSNKKINIINTLKYIELLNRYSYLLDNLNIFWICGDLIPRNENSTIKMIKKDNLGNKISQLTIEQYIIGVCSDKISDDEYGIVGGEYNCTVEISTSVGFDIELIDNKLQLDINYAINEVNKNFGYLEIGIDYRKINYMSNTKPNLKLNSKLNIEFVDVNKIAYKKQFKLEELKKKIKTQNIYEPNILDNIELSISDSSDGEIKSQLTDNEDPYKSKYLKYKKKLYKLRNNKKY